MKRRLKALAYVALLVIGSAHVWYVVLVLSGVTALSYGVALQFGRGYGFIAFGALALIGSEAIRNGLRT